MAGVGGAGHLQVVNVSIAWNNEFWKNQPHYNIVFCVSHILELSVQYYAEQNLPKITIMMMMKWWWKQGAWRWRWFPKCNENYYDNGVGEDGHIVGETEDVGDGYERYQVR